MERVALEPPVPGDTVPSAGDEVISDRATQSLLLLRDWMPTRWS